MTRTRYARMPWAALGVAMLGTGHLMSAQAACSVSLNPATATPTYSFSTSTPVTGAVAATQVTVTLDNCPNNGTLSAQPGNLSATGAGVASTAGNSINYQLRQDTSNGAVWGNTANTNTIAAGAANVLTVWITDRTNSGLLPPGTYTDSILVTHANSGGGNPTSQSLPISITAPSHCAIDPISNIPLLPYTSFQSAAESSTSFKVYCNIAYSIAVTPTSGTLAGNGLNYSLELNPTGGNQSANLAGTSHTLTGKVSAGQSGTCAAATCQGQSLHTVTVTY